MQDEIKQQIERLQEPGRHLCGCPLVSLRRNQSIDDVERQPQECQLQPGERDRHPGALQGRLGLLGLLGPGRPGRPVRPGLRQCPCGSRTGHLPGPPGRKGCHPGQFREPLPHQPLRNPAGRQSCLPEGNGREAGPERRIPARQQPDLRPQADRVPGLGRQPDRKAHHRGLRQAGGERPGRARGDLRAQVPPGPARRQPRLGVASTSPSSPKMPSGSSGN